MAAIEPSSDKTVNNQKGSKDVPWFLPFNSQFLSPAFSELLENYSGIPREEQEEHLKNIRDQAWEVFPFPCIGLWWWLALGLSTHPKYPDLLELLKTPAPTSPIRFLDLGTCLGQDLRKLAYDGVLLERLYSSDLFPKYETAGYALFLDQEKFDGRFITEDIFDESPDSALAKTAGTWSVVSLMKVLHCFDWDGQVKACKKVLRLLSKQPGSMIIGGQRASTVAGEQDLTGNSQGEGIEKSIFRQSKETFREMWEEIMKQENEKLKIWVEYSSQSALKKLKDDGDIDLKKARFFSDKEGTRRMMFFLIERL